MRRQRREMGEEKKKEIEKRKREEHELKWVPKTQLGRDVVAGKIKDVEEIFSNNQKIFESEVVDKLLPNLESDLINIGQAKGKFGGGKRRPWRQTQKKTAEGNVPTFSCLVVVGDKNGHVGLGLGRAKETIPAKEKAITQAKLNILSIKRGCGSFNCTCSEKHSIPFQVQGKCGSVRVTLIPAPKGTGLAADDDCKKILRLAGIKDVYSRSSGQTRTKINMARACIDALQKLDKFI